MQQNVKYFMIISAKYIIFLFTFECFKNEILKRNINPEKLVLLFLGVFCSCEN